MSAAAPGRRHSLSPRAQTRCVIADDHEAVRAAVGSILVSAGFEIVASVRNGDEALARILEHEPEVALVDIVMPGKSGIEIARVLRNRNAKTRLLIYTAHGETALLREALDLGVRGFVSKDGPLRETLRAVQAVAAGERYVDPALAPALFDDADTDGQALTITPREREVLRLLAEGMTSEEAAARLFISPDTVRTHVRHSCTKLNASTRTQAVAIALARQLISSLGLT